MDSLLDHAPVRPARRKLAVREYELMAAVGILHEDDRIELIEGEIIEMAPIGQDHEGATNVLTQALVLACLGRGIVSVQNSVRLDNWSMPQPDFAVFRFREDFYLRGTRPRPEDTLLLIEVADGSLRYDQTVKLPLYARAGIPEFWIVNIGDRTVDVHRRPKGDQYLDGSRHHAGDTITLVAEPAITLTLGVLFA